MSGFKTHLYAGMVAGGTTSTCFMLKYPAIFTPTQLSGIFLTGTIGGLLPDLDSDTSRPFSMLFTLLSMIVPVLFFKDISMIWLCLIPYIESFFIHLSKLLVIALNFFPESTVSFINKLNLFYGKISPFPNLAQVTPEFVITYFITSYLLIRYAICELVKRITIHRGIMHSIPFALLCAEAGFLIFIPSGRNMGIAVGISIFSGFMTHLVLDEINSITLRYGLIPKLKKSAGTALKFRSNSMLDTLFLYLLVIAGGVQVITLMGF